jgi:hypothetical protein
LVVVLEDKRPGLTFLENEFGGDAALVVEFDGNVGGKAEVGIVGVEADAAFNELDLVRLAAVVEGGAAHGGEANGTADATDSAVELMIRHGVGGEADGHEIF